MLAEAGEFGVAVDKQPERLAGPIAMVGDADLARCKSLAERLVVEAQPEQRLANMEPRFQALRNVV